MKKRILSILLSLCMVLMLCPVTVFAANDDATALQNLLNGGGTVTLSKDYTIDTTLNVKNTVTLDLNGYTISMTGNDSVIQVRSGGNLTVKDSRPTATHTDASLPAGGVITREKISIGGGGGVNVDGGSFTMNGGTIYNCSANMGGGVAAGGGSFTMNGGAIYGCNAKAGFGGGVAVGGSFTMNGGSIYGCSAELGDAVWSNRVSNIYANGGTIKGTVVSCGKILNTATDGGCTRFYDEVTNYTTSTDHGTISGGIYYGGISGGGTVEGTYYTVSFDLNGGSGSIPKQWFVNIDTAQALEPAAPTREGYEFAGWYNGDTKYDFTQNVTEDITLTAKWENPEAPVITGLEDGKTYCDTVQFEVSDNVGVASITANGVTLTPDANNKYTLEKGTGTVTVVAIDKANNQTSVTVTVNNGHTGGTATCTQKAKCDICGEEYGELANHSLSKTDAKEATCTEDGNIEYWTCSVCHKLFSDENGTNETTLEAVMIKATGHTLTKTEAKNPTCTEDGNTAYWTCSVCHKLFSDENGTNETTLEAVMIKATGHTLTKTEAKDPTCTEDGNTAYWTCSVCNKLFSDENGTNETTLADVTIKAIGHTLTKTEAKDATVTETGNIEYWHCKDCGKYFADENGTNEIILDDTVIAKLPPEIIEGKGQSITAGEKKELTFKSNAAFSDFIRVELDGKTLDTKNYTVKEGSTVVTLKADYVATLSAGEHTIGIVSESGTASTTFTVNAKAVVDNDTKSPQTGDNSHMALWIALLFVSGAGVIGTTVYGKKKRAK